MLTIPALANAPTALALPPSVLAVVSSDMVSTRATPAALPAPLSNQPAADNAQTIPAPVATAAANNTPPAAAEVSAQPGTLANNPAASGPSSSFLAQLFSQTDEENSVADYAHFAPAPEYNTFVGYSFIKYRPSDAGLPPQRSPLPAPVTTYAAPAPPVQATPVATPVVIASAPVTTSQDNQNTPVADATIAADTAASATPPPQQQNIPAPAAAAQNTVASTGVTNDFQAYSQTQSRNQSNLSFAEPQIVVAG